MKKKDVVDLLVERHGLSRNTAKAMVNDLINEFGEALQRGEDVHLSGLGTFSVVTRPARQARNPRSGETFMAPEGRRVRFQVSPKLKNGL